MSGTISAKNLVFDFLNEQLDVIKLKKSLKLNSLKHYFPTVPLADVIEYVYQYVNSIDPPLDIERISLANNSLDSLPLNFKLLTKTIRYLDLHNNNFYELPMEIYEFLDLEFLDASNNHLSYLSKSRMKHLSNLRLISLKNNRFKYLPPVLGDLPHLNLIEVGDNPLSLPPMEMIQKLQKQLAELDWVKELKTYLQINASLIESKIYDTDSSGHSNASSIISSYTSHSKTPSISTSNSSTPQLSRSKNLSETKTKSSKAARRMGLIIKKPDDIVNSSVDESQENDSTNSGDFPSPLAFPNPSSAIDTSFNLISPSLNPGTTTTSTATTVNSHVTGSQTNSPPMTPTLASASRLPKPRSRSNTLLEIDKMLEHNDNVDTEHKLGAYFRRLSTLAEIPVDELNKLNNHLNSHLIPGSSASAPSTSMNSNASSRNGSVSNPNIRHGQSGSTSGIEDAEDQVSRVRANSTLPTKSPPILKNNPSALSESSPNKSKRLNDAETTMLINVSRKVLFSFSELHSSVRRFSGFCVDKKVTIKMVSYLYTAKANIDSLVENLELMEENTNNHDKILESLNICIQSFKNILALLSENFSSFVVKIDICFIRMLYLTVYGSFNEIFNAYRILVPSANSMKSPKPIDRQKPTGLSINTNVGPETNNMEDVDAKLYDSIEIATSTAQEVFSELTRVISKSAIANANNVSSNSSGVDEIGPQVAGKVRELTTVCVSSMDITKRLRTKLITIRNNASFTTQKMFWDDTNLFLKAIIQTFSAVKNLMKDLPVLNEIRSSMAILTKSTKDVTILLEASSYKSMSNDFTGNPSATHPPALSSIPSVSNIFTPLSSHPTHSSSYTNIPSHQPHPNSHSQLNLAQLQNAQQVRTPLVAALGPAAQAILPLNSESAPPTLHHSGLGASPIISPSNQFDNPPQTSGQYFANNGVNPFDGLIMANERETRD